MRFMRPFQEAEDAVVAAVEISVISSADLSVEAAAAAEAVAVDTTTTTAAAEAVAVEEVGLDSQFKV